MHPALAPRLWPAHLLAVVLCLVAVGLGVWQLDAWQARRDDAARNLTQATPERLSDVIGPDDPFPGDAIGQPVELAGTWVPGGTVFIEGRVHDGRDGYWMVTPLAIGSPDGSAMPVVLGWVADPARAPAAPTGEADLTGWLQPTEGTGQQDTDPSDDVLPQLRIGDLIQHVDQDLYSAYVVSEQGQLGLPAGDLEQQADVGVFTGLRNFSYALEWWVFGGFVVLMWWRWLQEETAPPPDEDDGGGGGGGDDGDDEDPEDPEDPAPEAELKVPAVTVNA